VKPIFGQPAEYELVAALGRRLGLKDKDGKDFFKIGPLSGEPIENLTTWYEEFLSKELKEGAPKLTLAELKALPGAVWVDRKGTRYEKHAEALKAEQLAPAFFDGDPKKDGTAVYDKPKDQKGKRIGTVIGGKPVRGFATPSGRVEFVARWLAEKTDADGHPVDPLPVYTPRKWQPSTEYPLYFINWKEASHTHSRTQNNPWLLEIKPDNPLAIHPETAARFGVRDGEVVWVESPHGRVKAKVRVTARIHREVVGVQHGFGHTALGRLANGRGTSDSPLRPTTSDPLSGQALHKEACVRVAKA
jgi:thiosulfate reductase/polysulfide reductase chain A